MSSSAEIPGLGRPIRSPVDRRALVQYIRDSSAPQEKDWVEWKTGYDLTRRPGRASVAKHLIGFANRDPSTASQTSEGYAYLLLGVEPGSVPGLEVLDSADIENGIRPFVGDDLRFDVEYVSVDEAHVLLFTVNPPKPGDPIHCLQQSSEDAETRKGLREGTVYVRKSGKTEQASAEDVRRLTERARLVGTTLSLDVRVLDAPTTLPPDLLNDATRDRVIGEIRQRLMSGLPARSSYLDLSSDLRSRDRFTNEVADFVRQATARWEAYAAIDVFKRDPNPLRLELLNNTEHNYADVVVELQIPVSRDWVHFSVGNARDHLNPPELPKPYGTYIAGLLKPPNIRDVFIGSRAVDQISGDSSSTQIQFAPIHVRPNTPHKLSEVFVILGPSYAGADIPVRWRATSSSTSGQMSGTVTVSVE